MKHQMSLLAGSVTHFAKELAASKQNAFPYDQLQLFCQKRSPSVKELTSAYAELYSQWQRSYQKLKELLLVLSLAASRDANQLVVSGTGLLKRLAESGLSLSTDKTLIHSHYTYLGGTINLILDYLLSKQQPKLIIDLLYRMHGLGQQLTLSIGYIVAIEIAHRLMTKLTPDSQKGLLDLLGPVAHFFGLAPNQKNSLLIFQHTSLLKFEVDGTTSYNLTFKNGEMGLLKSDLKMPEWVLNGHLEPPTPVPTQCFPRNTVQLFKFLMQLEVYASSPTVECLNELIQENEFILNALFPYVTGQPVSSHARSDPINQVKTLLTEIKRRVAKLPQNLQKLLELECRQLTTKEIFSSDKAE